MSGVEFIPHPVAPSDPPAGPLPTPGFGPTQAFPDAVPAAARHGRLGRHSLTVRLILGVVSLVVVIVVGIGSGTYLALRSFLLDRLGQQLSLTVGQNAGFFVSCLHNQSVDSTGHLRCVANGPPPTQKEWVVALNRAGAPVLEITPDADGYVLPLTLSAAQYRAFVANPEHVESVEYGSTELLVSAHTTLGGITVVTGLSTDEVSRTMSRVLALELVIGGAAVVLALLTTTYGVRFSLRGLRRVTTTAQEVAAELSPTGSGLDRRVTVTEEGTEVGQLAESMNTLLSAVETQFAARLQSEARLRQFVADASHELRTPLTSIRGYAELARMQRAAGADSDDNLLRIESEGTRMSRLVEDLLTLARGEQTADIAAPRELVDVGEVLDDAVIGSRASFPGRTITEESATDLHVLGDHDQLLRVVRNLISNAAVHTEPDRPIFIRGVRDGNAVVVQVIDGGPGLLPDEAAHVFERFWRADKARSRARGGSGLGLAIVATIVAAHGGTVRFDSDVERGSTVTIQLPAIEY